MKAKMLGAVLLWTTCVSAEFKPPTPPTLKAPEAPKVEAPKVEAPKLEAPVTEKPELNAPKIVTVKQKDRLIQIKSGGAEPLYTVTDKKGKVLADNLTMAQLEAKDSKTAKSVKDAVAAQGKLDARLDK